MSKKARAAVLAAFKKPLEIKEYPLPEKLPPGAVLARVRLAGVCGTDHHIQQGGLPALPLPLILGHETVGVVEELGEGVETDSMGVPLKKGDLVTWMSSVPCGNCYFCKIIGKRNLCANRQVYGVNLGCEPPPHFSGGFAQYTVLRPGSCIVKVSEEVTVEDVVALGCAGFTAVNGVIFQTRVEPGDTVVVQGSGPVGIVCAMMAIESGASRIIMVGGPEKRLKFAEQLGVADETIDIFEVTDLQKRVEMVMEHTPAGRGADVVLECTGAPLAVKEGLDFVRRDGKFLVLGQYTDRGNVEINPHLITRKQVKIYGSWANAEPHFTKYIQLIPRLKAKYDLESMITIFRLTEANEALQALAKGEVIKAVIDPWKEE
jgi:threonine dehydrogenase-like Zn-dependent dehydrogenase